MRILQVVINTDKRSYKWEVVLLLWVAFFLNQADRQTFNIVLPQIQEQIGASDSTMGLLSMLFTVFFAITIPLAGILADKSGRSRQVWISTLVFSTATVCTGWSGGLFSLILFRCMGTAVGQGLFAPTYSGIIAQYHGPSTRARAISLHQTSSYLGIIVCGFLAGKIAETAGWPYAFFVFGGLGVLFTPVLAWRLRDKAADSGREEKAAAPKAEPVSLPKATAEIFRIPTATCIIVAYCTLIFGLNGYLTWMPKHLKESFDLSLSSAGFHSMFWHNAAAFLGIMVSGVLSDRIAARSGGKNRLLLQAAGLLLASPCIVLMGASHSFPAVCAALAGFGLFRGVFDSSLLTAFYEVIPPKYYSTSVALLFFFGNATGALSPWILGIISDRVGLSFGIVSMSAFWVAGSVAILLARVLFFEKDAEKCRREARG